MRGHARFAIGAIVMLIAVGCGDTPGNPFDSAATTSPPADATSTTVAEGTAATTVDDLVFDLDSVVPAPLPEAATDVDAVIGGAPNLTIADALTAAAAGAVDLTGVSISVWPVGGTGESLLVIDFADAAEIYADEGDDASTVLLTTLLASPLVDDQSITRVVIRYRDVDEQGPFVFTMTAEVAPLRESLATGVSLADGAALFAISREEG